MVGSRAARGDPLVFAPALPGPGPDHQRRTVPGVPALASASFLAQIQMQGKCGQFEDERGNIPQQHECRGSLTPPTRFEYEDGDPVFGIATVTKVHGGPPDAVERDNVLPFISSVGLVDFNRDGLPDVAQGWKQDLACETAYYPEYSKCEIAHPMVGYLNRGIYARQFVQLEHQCFDAGRLDDPTGLTNYHQTNLNGFFMNRGGATTGMLRHDLMIGNHSHGRRVSYLGIDA